MIVIIIFVTVTAIVNMIGKFIDIEVWEHVSRLVKEIEYIYIF